MTHDYLFRYFVVCVLSSTLSKPVVLHRIVQSKQKTWNYQVHHFLSSFSESVTFLCMIWIKVINNSVDLPHRTSLWHFIGLIWRVGAIPVNTAVQSKYRNCTERLLVSGMSSSNYTFWDYMFLYELRDENHYIVFLACLYFEIRVHFM